MDTLTCITRAYSHDKVFQNLLVSCNILGQIHPLHVRSNPDITLALANRRILLCKKLMADMRDESHPISFLAPKVTTRNIPYQLRSGNTTAPKTMKRTKRANDLFTFRFA